MIRPHRALGLALSLTLSSAALLGCAAPSSDPAAMGLVGSMRDTPAGAPAGTCWGKIVTPALIETVTEQVLVQEAGLNLDGSTATPAIYSTETRQRIVTERAVTWFETPCPADMTTDVVATLQRALAVRQFYDGPASGQIDAATNLAVGRYQAANGLQSRVLSLDTARALGVLATPRDQLGDG